MLRGVEGDHSQAINEAYCNGLTDIFVLELKPPIPWGKIIVLAILGGVQIFAGYCLVSTGMGIDFGTKLMWDGYNDVFNALKGIQTRDIKFGKWILDKGISWITQYLRKHIKSSDDGALSHQQQADHCERVEIIKPGYESLSVEQQGKKFARHQLMHQFKSSAGMRAQSELLDYVAMQPALNSIRKEIDQLIDGKITNHLKNNDLINKGIKLDRSNRNNYWQNLFIKEGLSLIKPSSELSDALIQICKSVSVDLVDRAIDKNPENKNEQKFPLDGSDVVDIIGLGKMVNDLWHILPSFLEKFESKIQKYADHILKAESQEKELESNAMYEESDDQVPDAVPYSEISFDSIHPDSLDGNVVISHQNLSSIQKAGLDIANQHTCYYPSGHEYITNHLKAYLTNKLTNSISCKLFEPIKNRLVNYTTKKMLEDDAKNLAAAKSIVEPQLKLHRLGKNVTTKKGNETKIPADLSSLSKELQLYVKDFVEGKPLGRTDIIHIAKFFERKIAIYVNGIYKYTIGPKNGKEPIPINLIKIKGPQGNEVSHWVNMKHPEQTVSSGPSGKNNCLFEAILPDLDEQNLDKIGIKYSDNPEEKGKKFREIYVETILKNPKASQKIVKINEYIKHNNPDDLNEGGSDYMDYWSIENNWWDIANEDRARRSRPEFGENEKIIRGYKEQIAIEKNKPQQEQKPLIIDNLNKECNLLQERNKNIQKEVFEESKEFRRRMNDSLLHFSANLATVLLGSKIADKIKTFSFFRPRWTKLWRGKNLNNQGGATKIPGATVKLPISYTRAQKVFGKNVKKIVTRERNNGKGRAYNIEFEDGTNVDIHLGRVKVQVLHPKNPGTGMANHNFAKKGGLPEDTKVLGTSGNNRFKRTLTQEEMKLFEDLKELIKD